MFQLSQVVFGTPGNLFVGILSVTPDISALIACRCFFSRRPTGFDISEEKKWQQRNGRPLLEWTVECTLGFPEHVSFNIFAFLFLFLSECFGYWISDVDCLGAVQISNTRVLAQNFVFIAVHVLNTFAFYDN